jgi:hypothetical protein
LSPYLFAIYVAGINGQDMLSLRTPGKMRLVSSYMDDFVILLASRTQESLKRLASQTWEIVKGRAAEVGLSFSARKSKISHQGHKGRWSPDEEMEVVEAMRILGYWWEKGRVGDYHFKH